MRPLRLSLALLLVNLCACECSKPPAVEDAGSCVANVACTTNPGAPCRAGKTSCATGSSVCVDGDSAMGGTRCGADKVCDGAGQCVGCVQGMACGLNPSAPCRLGTLDCAGTPTCKDGAPLDAGTSCGEDRVCSSTGTCLTCVANQACTQNAGAPCKAGVTSCSTGALTCVDGAAVAAGTSCGSNLVCSASGVCGACAANQACVTNPSPLCRQGVNTCTTGAQVCVDAAPRADGTGCGTNAVCFDGGCVGCTSGTACAPSANTCIGGSISCATGQAVCTVTGPVLNGTSCDGGACVRGTCTAPVSITASTNLMTDTLVAGRAPCADAPAYSVLELTPTTALLASAPMNCLVAGDEVLLINQQGSPAAVANVGAYESLTVASVAGALVTFTAPKTRAYGATADSNIGLDAGQQRVVVQRVPHYGDVAVAASGSVTTSAWNGFTGGVLAFRATSLSVDGTITVAGKGYRDGRWSTDGNGCTANVATEQGESIGGGPTQSTSANFGASGGIAAAGGPSFNGSTPITPSAGHATAGQAGVNAMGRNLGAPGLAYGSSDGGALTMGSGVGGNLTCSATSDPPRLLTGSSQSAGGVIFIGANAITVSATGRITADAVTPSRDLAPSAGSIMLRASALSLGSNRVTAIGATAVPGGAPTSGAVVKGSDGYVWLFSATAATGTTTPAPYAEVTPNP